MKLSEPFRRILAAVGGILWLTVSTFPFLSMNVSHEIRCDGRSFTGKMDDCFNDYIPMLEMLTPILALATMSLFLRFSFTLWSPPPESRTSRWRFASAYAGEAYWPALHIAAGILGIWCVWRATSYQLDMRLAPFPITWLGLATWSFVGLWVARPTSGVQSD